VKSPQKLYAIRNVSTGLIKIGIASNPQKRLKDLECGAGAPLELIYSCDVKSAPFAEAYIHKTLDGSRKFREWFSIIDLTILERIFSEASSLEPDLVEPETGGWDDVRKATRRVIEDRGLSQSQLERVSGLRADYISKLLRGDKGEAPPSWITLLEALDLELKVVPKGESDA
jgi:hypothetical protein